MTTPAERQRAYRERKREEAAAMVSPAVEVTKHPPLRSYPRKAPDLLSKLDKALIFDNEVFIKDIPYEQALPLADAPFIGADRTGGLPRSNYDSVHEAPGGWAETIRKMDPHLLTRILDKVAPPRRMR